MAAVEALIARFEQLAQTRIKISSSLSCSSILTAQALDRSHFAIGIDNSVALDVARLYPRLLHHGACAAALQQRFRHAV